LRNQTRSKVSKAAKGKSRTKKDSEVTQDGTLNSVALANESNGLSCFDADPPAKGKSRTNKDSEVTQDGTLNSVALANESNGLSCFDEDPPTKNRFFLLAHHLQSHVQRSL